jgi:hypothetical protein
VALNAGKTAISSAVPVIIEQMSASAEDNYQLVLYGRAMPYRPLDFKKDAVAVKHVYPGNPEATIHMLGIDHPNTTWKGMWKTRFLADVVPPQAQGIFDAAAERATQVITSPITGAGEPINDAITASQAVAMWGKVGAPGERLKTAGEVRDKVWKLQQDGIRLKVTWDDVARVGIIKGTSFPTDRREDIAWEIEWMWLSDAIPTRVAVVADQDLSQFPEGLLDKVQNFRKTVTAPARFAKAVLDAIDEDINLIESSILEMSGIVTDYTDLGVEALDTLQNAMGVANTVRLAAFRITDSLDAVSAEWSSTTDQFSDVAAAAGYKTEAKSQMSEIAADAGAMMDAIASWIEPEVEQSFVMPRGMDLRGVSTKFYGTPDNWRDIADYNMIEGTQVEAGLTILIPTLPRKF